MDPRAGLDRFAENLVPTGIRSPDRPARSQSLYRLRNRAHVSSDESTILIKLKAVEPLFFAHDHCCINVYSILFLFSNGYN